MPPLADFVCNSPKCRKNGAAPVYELPVKATHCPMGHKRIVRLFNKVGVLTGRRPDHFDGRHTSSSKAARIDALVQQPVEAALSKRSELKGAGQRWKNDNGMVRTVPLRNLPSVMAQAQGGQPFDGNVRAFEGHRVQVSGSKEERIAAAQGGTLPDTVDPLVGAPIPKQIIARDTEYKVVRGADGLPEAAGA